MHVATHTHPPTHTHTHTHTLLYLAAEYIEQKLGIPEDEVPELRHNWYLKHGTTCCGLVNEGYTVDYDDWHDHVHGKIDYDNLIRPEPGLRSLLEKISARLYVFTNADKKHAHRCLSLLGIEEGVFDDIVHFESIMSLAHKEGLTELKESTEGPTKGIKALVPIVCKPQLACFQLALKQAGLTSAEGCVFIDDSRRNILGAKKAGFTTVWVSHLADHESLEAADYAVTSLLELPHVFPELFRGGC